MAAAAVVVLAAVAGVAYLLSGRNAAAAGIGASGRPAIAVMPFENPGGAQDTAWLTSGLPGMLVTGLGQATGLDVIGSQRIDEILKDVGGAGGGRIEASKVLDVGRRAGAGAMVVGNIFQTGSEFRIDVQIQEVADGRLLGAHSVRGTDVFRLADDLTGRILGSLNVASGSEARSVAEVTSSSSEAYRLYTEGVRAVRLQRRGEARKALEAAVAADPTFAAAWLELAGILGGLDDRAGEARARKQVLAHRDRLPERQRLLFDATEAGRTGTRAQAVEALERLASRYPDEEIGHRALISSYRGLGDTTRAIQAAERGIKALPQVGTLRNMYGYMLLDVGRYPEAVRELETYTRLDPNEPNPLDSLAEAYLIMSQPAAGAGPVRARAGPRSVVLQRALRARDGVRHARPVRHGAGGTASRRAADGRGEGPGHRRRYLRRVPADAIGALPRGLGTVRARTRIGREVRGSLVGGCVRLPGSHRQPRARRSWRGRSSS